jgi:hypothetical protein
VPEATIDRLDEHSEDADAALADLWERYVAGRAPELRDRLILHYAPLVKYVAGRVGSGLPAHVEQADLVSYGTATSRPARSSSRATRWPASAARSSTSCAAPTGSRARCA